MSQPEQKAKATYSGSRQYIQICFSEFKVNVLTINVMKIFLTYASVNLIRIFQHQFLIYASVSHNKNLAMPV